MTYIDKFSALRVKTVCAALQRQKAVTANFKSKLLQFVQIDSMRTLSLSHL